MKRYTIIIGGIVVVAAVIIALWMVNVRVAKAPGAQACTQEAKICPDGSSVGRTGPNCEFAACPSTGPVSLEVRLGQEADGLGVRITPSAVLEDSRCPTGVLCIQAGTVRLSALLATASGEVQQEFKLGQPVTSEGKTVTLVEVLPYPRAGVKTKESDYVFRFEVVKR